MTPGVVRLLVTVLAIATVVVGLTFATRAAGSADPYGYVSQVDLWIAGSPKVEQPWMAQVPWSQRRWAFAPIGYRPLDEAGRLAIVSMYPAGLPMLMAAAKKIGGACAVFWVVPLSGGLLVLVTYGIGRRIGSPQAGAIAAWLVATSPAFLFMLMAPMTDVPVAAFWAAALYLLLRPTLPSTLAGGLVAAVAILIRPNLVHLAGVLGLWLLVRASADRLLRARLTHAVVFALAAAPGIVATLAINRALFGSLTGSGYGRVGDLFGWANVLPNMAHYVSWAIGSQTPLVLVGLAALALPLARLWPGTPDRRIFLIIGLFFLGVCAPYAAYGNVDDVWWMLRYMLPLWPFVMIGLASATLALVRGRGRAAMSMAVLAVALLGLNGLRIASARSVFDLWKDARRFVSVAKIVQGITDPNSVIFSREHSGSLRYYAGRMTIRFDAFDEDWLDRGIPWLASHGSHPYVVLDEFEVEHFRRHFAGQAALVQLDRPMVIYRGTGTVFVYDLLAPKDPARAPDTITENFTGPACVAPAPAPQVVLR